MPPAVPAEVSLAAAPTASVALASNSCAPIGPNGTGSLLPFAPLLAALHQAVLSLQAGRIHCPERLVVPLADGGLLLAMPAVADDVAVHKLISVVPGNAARGLPVIQGQVTVLDSRSGAPLVQLDGPTVTGRRTAAMSMLGIQTLWQRPLRRVLLVGTGAQAAHHVQALAALQPQAAVLVRGTSPAAAQRFCAQQAQHHPRLSAVVPGAAGAAAAASADVVITCTTSLVPVVDQPARPDCLLIATGSFTPAAAEIAAATVRGSQAVVDDMAGARHEAGDLLQAGVDWTTVLPLAQLLQPGAAGSACAAGAAAGLPARPLLFKTVGCAAWDLAAARVALQQLSAAC